MKRILFTIAMMPGVALAQFDSETAYDAPEAPIDQPSYPIAVQPILPVPRGTGPWGTGYSIVTETRERPDALGRFLGDRDASTTTTTQKVVPNDALGNPIDGSIFDW
jgi:hypothetical protein